MEALKKRVADRVQEERKHLQAEQMTLGKRRVALSKEAERCLATVGKLVTQLRDGKPLGQTATRRLHSAERRVAEIARELEANAARTASNAAQLAVLETGKELDRRLKAAKALGVEEPLRGPDAAEVVLLHAGKPLKVDEITRIALETGVVKRLAGKTPKQTISGYMSKAAKQGDKFVRVGPATYDLKTRTTQTKTPA